MSAGAPSKYCPRCNTVLPLQSAFCGNCGYQFNLNNPGSAPQGANYGSNYGPAQYVGQNAPGGWPQGQPGYPPQGQPGYPPQGQPGYPPQGQPGFGYPAAPPKKKGGAGRLIALVLVLVIVVGGGAAAWFLYLSPSKCSGPLFDRHGLQSNVPLPSGCAFDSHPATQTSSSSGATFSGDTWTWTVSSSDPATVQQFYQDNLKGSNGWTKITPSTDKSTGQKSITACQGSQLLVIAAGTKLDITDSSGKTTRTLNAPSGGSALGVALVTATNNKGQLELQLICSGNTAPGGINP